MVHNTAVYYIRYPIHTGMVSCIMVHGIPGIPSWYPPQAKFNLENMKILIRVRVLYSFLKAVCVCVSVCVCLSVCHIHIQSWSRKTDSSLTSTWK